MLGSTRGTAGSCLAARGARRLDPKVGRCLSQSKPPPLSEVNLLKGIAHRGFTSSHHKADFKMENTSEEGEKNCGESTQFASRSTKRRRDPEKTRLKDIIGHGVVKNRIDEIILPLGLPKAVTEEVFSGIRSISSSILLHGPPGCGKTKLARAIAGEARAALVLVTPSDILSKFVGDSESSVRNTFLRAVREGSALESKCAVVFFDEIDALGQNRDNMGVGEGEACSRRVLIELMLHLNTIADRKYCCLSDFESSEEGEIFDDMSERNDRSQDEVLIIIVAATNRPDDCDPALLRRFGTTLEVGLPSKRDRKKMLKHHLQTVVNSITEAQFDLLATITGQYWTGSDIENLCREAAMAPIRECLRDAAVVRRQSVALEQYSGASSQEAGGEEVSDPDTRARDKLLAGFRNLRPVTAADCIAVFEARGFDVSTIDVSTINRQAHYKKARAHNHYDTSSSEED